jgi:hypothetical protein
MLGNDGCYYRKVSVMKRINDPIVHVDLLLPPYGWQKKVRYPELEMTGPDQFDVRQLERWIHPNGQEDPDTFGSTILEYLEENSMLTSCLGVRDLLGIKRRGLGFFKKHFQGKLFFGWRSVVQVTYEDAPDAPELVVPCLGLFTGEVVLDWRGVTVTWDSNYYALRFPS